MMRRASLESHVPAGETWGGGGFGGGLERHLGEENVYCFASVNDESGNERGEEMDCQLLPSRADVEKRENLKRRN